VTDRSSWSAPPARALAAGSQPATSVQTVTLIVLWCFVLSVVALLLWLPNVNFADFESYAAAVRRALDGHAIYASFQTSGPYQLPEIIQGRGFAYPPSAVLLLAPTAIASFAAVPFVLVSLTLMTAVVVLIVRAQMPSVAWIGWLLAALILLSPAAGDAIYVGQVTPLLAAAFGASWLLPRWSGYLGVMGGAIKIYPALLIVWAVRNRVDVVRPLLVAAILVVVATVWLGADQWLDFVAAWKNARPQCVPPSMGSLTCSLGPLGAVGGVAAATGLSITAMRITSASVAFLLIAVASVIAAPDVFPNYLLIVVVGGLPLTCRLLRGLLARFPRLGLERAAG
jgi:glycosyl transferase family 87